MRMTVSGSDLNKNISSLISITKSDRSTFVVREGKAYVIAQTYRGYARIKFDLAKEGSDDGSCTLNNEVLLKAIKGRRGAITLRVNDESNEILVTDITKSNKFICKMKTLEAESASPPNVKNKVTLNTNLQKKIYEAIECIKIANIFDTNVGIDVNISVKDSEIRAYATDKLHLARYVDDVESDVNIDLNISLDLLMKIKKIAENRPYSINVDEKGVLTKNDRFTIFTPTYQTHDLGKNVDAVLSGIKELGDVPYFTVGSDLFESNLFNTLSVYIDGSIVSIKPDDKGKNMRLHCSTSTGEVRNEIHVEECTWGKREQVELNPHLVLDVLRLMKSDLIFIEKYENFIVIRSEDKQVLYVISCFLQ